MALIETQNLSKHFKVLNRREGLKGAFLDLFSGDYRTVKAVDDVSFSIEEGEVVGYIGPNGAGKSTTIKMMTGILQPTAGTIMVNQIAPYDNRNKPIVDVDDATVPLNYFNIVKLKAGEAFTYQVPGYETCIVPATGTVDIDVEGCCATAWGWRTSGSSSRSSWTSRS